MGVAIVVACIAAALYNGRATRKAHETQKSCVVASKSCNSALHALLPTIFVQRSCAAGLLLVRKQNCLMFVLLAACFKLKLSLRSKAMHAAMHSSSRHVSTTHNKAIVD